MVKKRRSPDGIEAEQPKPMRKHLGSWKRRPVEWRVRLGIMAALALLALVPGYLALRAFQSSTTVVHQVPVWGWAHRGQWDYTVFVRPNTVYGATTLGPGLTYYDNLVEGIEARFSYTFATDAPAVSAAGSVPITININRGNRGWYQVTAELAAGELLRERIAVVPKTPLTTPQEEDSGLGLELSLNIDRGAFLARLEELAAEAGVPIGRDATVTYTARVEVTAVGPTGETRQVLEPTLVVPLTGQTFTISGDGPLAEDGVFRQSEERPRPGVTSRRRDTVLATVLTALLLPVFALATTGAPRQPATREDALARQARSIARKYRKRLAQAAPGDRELPGAEVVPVAGMADLARVSEELLKPIVYRPSASAQESHIFYIVDGATRYEFLLGAP